MSAARPPASELPVARVLPLLGLSHLDREFDYEVAEDQSEDARPGVRVRVRFQGRLVDGILMARRESSDFNGRLSRLERVISPEVVLPERSRELVERLAARYAATRSDIIRSAVPPRHAGAERALRDTPWEELAKPPAEPDLSAWSGYAGGEGLVDDVLAAQRPARAAWQVCPGERWERPLAALLAKVAIDGGGALAVVPDQRDLARLEAALRDLVAAKQITVLGSTIGPQARYSRFLSVLHGQGRLVIGTRSAAYAPVKDLRLAAILFDGDDAHADPRAPYAHAREVLTMRSAIEGASLIVGGFARTTQAQVLVEAGWLREVSPTRDRLRAEAPRVHAAGDSDVELARDPRARADRIPGAAFAAARAALKRGRPVLVQTPRRGYIPTLRCGRCRHPARCRACNGPLEIPAEAGGQAGSPRCRWCGRIEPHFRCPECGSSALRAQVLGNERTAEELGRAFPQVPIVTSGGERIKDSVADRPALVVATPGAEPVVEGGLYGAALLLDTWAQLGRQALNATEQAFERWAGAAALVEPLSEGGEVVVVADPALPVVQRLIRFDAAGSARAELAQRREVHLPPAVRMAAVDGSREAVAELLSRVELPELAEVLGPVELPPGETLPGGYDEAALGPAQRVLIRTPLALKNELARALRAAAAEQALRRQSTPLRVRIDPTQIG